MPLKRLFSSFVIIILSISSSLGKGDSFISIPDNASIISITEYPYYVYEDKNGKIRIEDLITNPELFSQTNLFLPKNDNRSSAYWVKFPIIDSSSYHSRWILELYNYRIDSLEVYVVYKGKILEKNLGGDHYLFSRKEIPHKNFAFILPPIKNDTLYYYIRGKAKLQIDFFSVIKRADYFIQYSNNEYYLLGMLYGILSILLLYNLIYLFILREQLYLYYLFATIGFIIYFMTKDGTGFQYLWYDYPFVNDLLPNISLCFAIINQLLFTWSFFRKKFTTTLLSKIISTIIAIRIIYLIIDITILGELEHLMVVDIPLIILMLWIGIKNIQKNEPGTFYFPIGVALLLIGYSATALYELNLGIIPYSTFVIYGSAIGVVAQISAFWGSLSFRHRETLLEQKMAEYKLQLKNIEFDYLQKYKKELEYAVHEATQSIEIKSSIIEETNKNLETFIYKTSHNLRSPLSSIMGLYNISIRESDQEKLKELFTHINKAAIAMDNELTLVSKAASINNHSISIEEVNLFDLTKNIFDESCIQLLPNDYVRFQTNADRWLLEEMMQYIKTIYYKLTSDKTINPKIEIKADNELFTCTLEFKTTGMIASYIEDFFTPYHKDISHIYGLNIEPYLCRTIMARLRGTITIKLEGEDKLTITLKSKY